MDFLNHTISETLTHVAQNAVFLTVCYAIFFIALFVYLYTGILLCEGQGNTKKSTQEASVLSSSLPVVNPMAFTTMYENVNWLIESQEQYSPLNIHRNVQTDPLTRKLEALHWENHNMLPSILLLQNTGQNAILQGIYPFNKPIVHGAGLPASYSFVQISFRLESDHMLEDRKFPLEMQVLYRFDSEEQEAEEELSSHDTLIFAFLFDVGEYNGSLQPITDNLQHIRLPSSKVQIPIVPLGAIMPLYVGGFYCYVGSMIDHPFYQGVKWSVYSKLLSVGRDQLDEFHLLLGCDRKPIKHKGRHAKSPVL